ncbi:myosin heavy chain, cardiac muscle isoform-like isoform X2 [Papaver somniferum]|uniref:myosin heavy chain, cardiac muscle isoform-like isoform X2 n=1 Tax=Papaver somniferum TaxID=3469 RepID=UPI000E700B1A|nr:myosin heavy chain, cardiac muscle isoform-like isoform X2 [Papaver somniferum]
MDIVVHQYQCEIRKKCEEIDFWKEKSFVLQSQCMSQNDELNAYKVKYDALDAQFQDKNLGSDIVEGKLKDLTNEVSETEIDKLKYQIVCGKLNEHIEELKTRCEELNKQVELNLKQEADLERELKDCKAQGYETHVELNKYKKKCDDSKRQVEKYKRRCKDLKIQVDERRKSQHGLEKLLDIYKAKYDEMHAKHIEGLRRRCEESSTHSEPNVIHEVDLETQCNDMDGELNKYKTTCDNLNGQIEELKRRCKDLESQVKWSRKSQVGLEKQLNIYKGKHDEMYARFKERTGLVVSLDNDLMEHKRMCAELNQWVESLEDEVRATRDETGNRIDRLKKVIGHLGRDKRRAEDECEVLKIKFRESESQTALYLKELDDYKVKCHGFLVELQKKAAEHIECESKLKDLALITTSSVDELEGYKTALNGLKKQITSLTEDRKVLSEREKKAEERVASLQEVIKNLVEEKSSQLSGDIELYSSPPVNRGPMPIEKQSEPLVILNEDSENAVSLFKMECTDRYELEEREIGLSMQDSKQPAGISENENDKEIRPKHTCDVGCKQRLDISTGNTIERLSNSTKCLTSLETPLFGQKGEEYAIKCEPVDLPVTSAPKRKRLLETVTDIIDEDDKSLVSKRRVKKPEELTGNPTSEISTMNLCAGDVSVSSKDQNAQEYTTNLQERLVSENKSQADRTSKDEKSPHNLEMDESSQVKVCSLTTESEKVEEETDSDSGDCKSEAAMGNELDSNDEKDST